MDGDGNITSFFIHRLEFSTLLHQDYTDPASKIERGTCFNVVQYHGYGKLQLLGLGI